MFKPPLNLANARVLISNDDGIHGVGMKVLEKAIRKVAREVWVVAPDAEQSGASHSLSLRSPLRLTKVGGKRRYTVDGTPTDSVLLAVLQLMRDNPPDLILSGVNKGANMGEDVTYSGTVAAAMEGTLLGIPSIAFSQVYTNRAKVPFDTAATHLLDVITKLTQVSWPKGVLMNVNFPAVAAKKVTGIEVTVQGHRKLGGVIAEDTDPRGEPFYWIASQRTKETYPKGTDLEAVGRGAISVTPISVEMTHKPTVRALRKVFK